MSVTDDLNRLGAANIRTAVATCNHHSGEQWSYPARLLAICSRESNCENIEGDFGNGKGAWQIDRRSWAPWLQSHFGVRSGTWSPIESGVTAYTAGFVPTLRDGLGKAIELLRANWLYGKAAGLTDSETAWLMVSGYNCGPANALNGLRQHGNTDTYTTGGNYAHDVFARETEAHAYLKQGLFL